MVNRPGLSCAGTFEAHGITDWQDIDGDAQIDKLQTAAPCDDVTQAVVAMRSTLAKTQLNRTQVVAMRSTLAKLRGRVQELCGEEEGQTWDAIEEALRAVGLTSLGRALGEDSRVRVTAR